MKVFTTGNMGFVSPAVSAAMGSSGRRQGRVLVAAPNKATAYAMLAERHLEPGSINHIEFRQASGNDVDWLTAAGVFDTPIVIVSRMGHMYGPVVRVNADRTPTVIGRIAQDGWHPQTPEMVDAAARNAAAVAEVSAAAAAGDLAEEEEMLLARLASNKTRVQQVNDELARLRSERQELALRARELDVIAQAASELGVSPARVSQLADAALAERANRKRRMTAGAVLAVVGPPVSRRVGYLDATILKLEQTDPGTVRVWVNSGGNALVAEQALVAARYTVRSMGSTEHGSFLVVTR